MAAPDAAPVIRGTGGIRKLRWAGFRSWEARGYSRRLLSGWPRRHLFADGLCEGRSR